MKNVLIALDYDPAALKVAETGYSMAKALNAGVVLLHVFTDPKLYASMDSLPAKEFAGLPDASFPSFEIPENAEMLKNASHHFLDRLKKHLGDKTIETIVKEGDYADIILASARDMKSEFIVMGSHSRNWLDEIIIGSVTEKVLHHSSIPLYIIPTKRK